MLNAAAGDLLRIHFPLFQEDGITPETGVPDVDFDKLFIRDDNVSGVSGTVYEVGVTGVYYIEFTPDLEGRWYVEVSNADLEDIYSCLVDVGPAGAPIGHIVNEAQMNVAYDESITTLYMEVWLDRNGESVGASDLVSCSVSVYDDAGTLLFTESETVPDPNGRYSIQRSGVTLSPDKPYNATVTVTDSRGSVITFQAFTTVG